MCKLRIVVRMIFSSMLFNAIFLEKNVMESTTLQQAFPVKSTALGDVWHLRIMIIQYRLFYFAPRSYVRIICKKIFPKCNLSLQSMILI